MSKNDLTHFDAAGKVGGQTIEVGSAFFFLAQKEDAADDDNQQRQNEQQLFDTKKTGQCLQHKTAS